MPIVVNNVIKANIVLVGIELLNDAIEVLSFSEAVATDVVSPPGISLAGIPTGAEDIGRKLFLDVDRVVLDLAASRSIVERDYPEHEGLGRLAEVATHAVVHTDLQGRIPQAFGYNIELVYNQNSGIPSSPYLAGRLFTGDNLGKEGWQLVGGRGRLVYIGDGAQWSFTVEPRFNNERSKRIFLSANLHISEQRLPDRDEMAKSLQEIWEQAHNFATRLDLNVQ